jgi:hypothetical protein
MSVASTTVVPSSGFRVRPAGSGRPAGSPWSLRPAESQPVAAVRVVGSAFSDVRDGLREAGFAVLDILSRETGPAPLVLVLEVPQNDELAERLLAAGANGPARVLIVEDRDQLSGARLRAGVDEVLEGPFHPLQVAASALRVSGAPEWQLAHWSEAVFAGVSSR